MTNCAGQEADIEEVSIVSQWDNSVCDSAGDEIGISTVPCSPVTIPCTHLFFIGDKLLVVFRFISCRDISQVYYAS